MVQDLLSAVAGFIDTLPAIRNAHPGCVSYTQEHLFRQFVGTQGYDAHNAIGDVNALSELYDKCLDSDKAFTLCVTSQSSFDVHAYNLRCKKLAEEMKACIPVKALSNGMAKKIASSGLSLADLRVSFRRNGAAGLRALLAEPDTTGRPRVTKSAPTLAKLAGHFAETEAIRQATSATQCEDISATPSATVSAAPSSTVTATPSATVSAATSFTVSAVASALLPPATLALYRRRKAEGYDLPDPAYMKWLRSVQT
ncbi:uncharacterized protein LOC135829779 [Sycon ciliatum]|uniref:uncharacterized protein LOC135829779 n=1 Tax=Sycon ciliatum TaxID=27933 RepID=UPI0031F61643